MERRREKMRDSPGEATKADGCLLLMLGAYKTSAGRDGIVNC